MDRVATGSFLTEIRVGLDSDSEIDPNPSSKSIRVDLTDSSSETSNTSGEDVGFVFCCKGGLGDEGGGCCGSKGRVGY